jgi:hypothetical protein
MGDRVCKPSSVLLCRHQLLLIVEIILSGGCWLLKKKLKMPGGEKAMLWREVMVN